MSPFTSKSKSKSTSASSMKQSTLAFNSKRSHSNASAKKTNKKTTGQTLRSTPVTRVQHDSDSSEEDDVEDIEFSLSEDDEIEVAEDERPPPPTKSKSVEKKTAPAATIATRDTGKAKEAARQELKTNDRRWNTIHAATRQKRSNLDLIHCEQQNRIHDILRVFDLSYEYGPCVGVTRLERWERAYALGLNPPKEIKEILSTRQGVEETQYSHSVFHEEV